MTAKWLLLLLILAGPTAGAEVIDTLDLTINNTREQVFKPYSPAEMVKGEQLFEILLGPVPEPSRVASQAASLGLEVDRVDRPFAHWRVVDRQRGMGFYLLPIDAPSRGLAVQVPHRRSDRLTQDLALQWIQRRPPAAYAFNSLHRSVSDLAHEPNSLFVAFARAFAQRYPSGSLVQLHGFATAKRRTEAARRAALIISSGTSVPSRRVEQSGACLQRLEPSTRIYPYQVNELGGTLNVSGDALRSIGHGGFIHLEMNLEFRRRWRDDPAVGEEVWRCLSGL